MTQEGATEFEDMEGGGIGEGEGVKDVSDQIDNEGQVSSTFQKLSMFPIIMCIMRELFKGAIWLARCAYSTGRKIKRFNVTAHLFISRRLRAYSLSIFYLKPIRFSFSFLFSVSLQTALYFFISPLSLFAPVSDLRVCFHVFQSFCCVLCWVFQWCSSFFHRLKV